jgi:uncharacterized protein (DUF1778 family)
MTNQHKTSTICFRCTPEEQAALEDRADRAGTNLSDYARRSLVEGSALERHRVLLQVVSEQMFFYGLTAAQDGKDLADPLVAKQLEEQAIMKAETLVGRRILLLQRLDREGKVQAA